MTLGDHIRHYRVTRRWTQVRLGAVAGLHPNTIARLERGDVRNPSGRTLAALAKALEVPMEDLLAEGDSS